MNAIWKRLWKPPIIRGYRTKMKMMNKMSTSSYQTKFVVEEIKIPHQKGKTIACKLWRGIGDTDTPTDLIPTVCVHGWLDNANSYDTLLPRIIRPGEIFYAFDLPGHGFSSHLDHTHYNLHTDIYIWIHRVVEHLQLTQFNLMGHSVGGKACIVYSGTFPQFVRKVIGFDVVNPRPRNWVHSAQAFIHGLKSAELQEEKFSGKGRTKEDLLERLVLTRADMVDAEGCKMLLPRSVRQLNDGLFEFTHDVRLKNVGGFGYMFPEQLVQFLEALECQLCILKSLHPGEYSAPATADFQDALDQMTENKDKVEFHLVDGGHHVHLCEPQKVEKIVRNFLNRL